MSEDSLTNANNNSETSNQDYDGTMAGDASASRPVHKPRKIVSYGSARKSKVKISYGGHALGVVSNGSQKAKSYEEFTYVSRSRIRRRRWWGWHFLMGVGGLIVIYALTLCAGCPEVFAGYFLLYQLYAPGIFAILRLRADVARCHDLGWSGWVVLPFFVLAWIPVVNYLSEFVRVIMFGCMDGQPFTNKFGPDPKGRNLSGAQPQPSAPSQPTQMQAPLGEQLHELKKLLDEGILTQEEFDTQKAKVLAGESVVSLSQKADDPSMATDAVAPTETSIYSKC